MTIQIEQLSQQERAEQCARVIQEACSFWKCKLTAVPVIRDGKIEADVHLIPLKAEGEQVAVKS